MNRHTGGVGVLVGVSSCSGAALVRAPTARAESQRRAETTPLLPPDKRRGALLSYCASDHRHGAPRRLGGAHAFLCHVPAGATGVARHEHTQARSPLASCLPAPYSGQEAGGGTPVTGVAFSLGWPLLVRSTWPATVAVLLSHSRWRGLSF